MLRWLQRAWSEIKRGENIDLYVTLLGAFAATAIGLVIDPESWMDSIPLAVLGLVAFGVLGNRHKLEHLIELSGVPSAPLLKHRRDLATLPENAAEAKDILIIACTASTILLDTSFFIDSAKQGTHIRLAVINPDETAVVDILGRMDIMPRETLAADMGRTMGLLKRIAAHVSSVASFKVRVLNHLPTLSFIMIDGNLSTGRIIVEMYPYQCDPTQRPHYVVTARDHPDWFRYFGKICEDIWNQAEDLPLYSPARQ
jgi:hypothetical protein